MKKFLNYLPLTALVLGFGLIFSMSSFKAERVLNTYYLDQNDNTWKPLTRTFDNTLNEDLEYDENSYQCAPSEAFCTGEFDSSAATIPGTVDPDGASTLGIYTPNPEPVQ